MLISDTAYSLHRIQSLFIMQDRSTCLRGSLLFACLFDLFHLLWKMGLGWRVGLG